VVEAIEGRKNLGVVAGVSFLNYKEKDPREISDYINAGLIKGLKFYPGYEPFYPYDNRLKVFYDLATEYNIPVIFHSGDTYSPKGRIRYSHPIHVDEVAVDNPEMKIVICHVSHPWIKDCMEVMYKNKNVHADISRFVLGDFSEKFEQYLKAQIEEMIFYAGEP